MNDMSGTGRQNPSAKPCPICRKPAAERYTPFCSKRCSDIDLGRWLDGRYIVESEDSPGEEDGES